MATKKKVSITNTTSNILFIPVAMAPTPYGNRPRSHKLEKSASLVIDRGQLLSDPTFLESILTLLSKGYVTVSLDGRSLTTSDLVTSLFNLDDGDIKFRSSTWTNAIATNFPVLVAPTRLVVVEANVIPQASLAKNGTNATTLTFQKRDSGGANPVSIATLTTDSDVTTAVDLTAYVKSAMTLVSTMATRIVEKGRTISLDVALAGDGGTDIVGLAEIGFVGIDEIA